MAHQDRSLEERLRVLFAAVPDLVLRIRGDGTFLDFSPSTEFTTYVPPDRFLHRKIHEIMPLDAAETITAGIQRALAMRSRETVEYQLPESGGTRHYEARMIAVGKDDVVAIVRDITRAKEAEAKLLASEQRYRELVDNSQGLICTHDLDGHLTAVNPAAAVSVGYDADELVGMNLRDLVASRVQHEVGPYLKRIREVGRDSGILLVNARDGAQRYWTYANSLKIPAFGDPYVIGHALDVTDLKRAEHAARALARRCAAFYREGPFGLGSFDSRGTIVEANAHLARLAGAASRDALVGQNWSDEVWVERLLTGKRIAGDVISFPGGGTARLTGWPLEDHTGTVSGAEFVAEAAT
jgi:PAS domain S-box-containing protein